LEEIKRSFREQLYLLLHEEPDGLLLETYYDYVSAEIGNWPEGFPKRRSVLQHALFVHGYVQHNRSLEEIKRSFREQLYLLLHEEPDGLLLETYYDLEEAPRSAIDLRASRSGVPSCSTPCSCMDTFSIIGSSLKRSPKCRFSVTLIYRSIRTAAFRL
jgi:methionine synthase I (cobalamin-dependent)